jgi:hypothetical protein
MKMVLTAQEGIALAEWISLVILEKREVCMRLVEDSKGESWTVFWKVKPYSSRLLLARPDAQSWVATVVLEESVFNTVIDHLRSAKPCSLKEIATIDSVSNFLLSFTFQD